MTRRTAVLIAISLSLVIAASAGLYAYWLQREFKQQQIAFELQNQAGWMSARAVAFLTADKGRRRVACDSLLSSMGLVSVPATSPVLPRETARKIAIGRLEEAIRDAGRKTPSEASRVRRTMTVGSTRSDPRVVFVFSAGDSARLAAPAPCGFAPPRVVGPLIAWRRVFLEAGAHFLAALIFLVPIALVAAYAHRGWSRLALVIGGVGAAILWPTYTRHAFASGSVDEMTAGFGVAIACGVIVARELVLWVRRGFQSPTNTG